MYPISQPYSDFLQKRARTWLLKADINGAEYGKDKIVSLDIENSLSPYDDFTIGAAVISKMIIKIRAPDAIEQNARIVPYISLSLAGMRWDEAVYPWEDADFTWLGGGLDWLPLGEFFIDKRERVNNVWVYTCYDKLTFANAPYISSLTYPATQQAVWDEICTRLGYTYDSSVQINPSYMIPVAPTGYSYRQVMGYIAGANSASVFVGKDGTIKFRRFSAAETPAFKMGLSDYIRLKQTNPQRTFTRIVVTYNKEDDLKVEAGAGDESQTLSFENPFVTQEIVNDLLANLNGFSYVPVEIDARGYPQIDVGDRIEYGQQEGYKWNEANMPWEEADFPWDGITYHQTVALRINYGFKGGLRMGITAPSQSFQQSEFAVKGPLSSQIDMLNQTTVKQGRNYFGVTITKEEGLIVERDDHASKVILNSDEFTFWIGDERALWFDPWEQQYKFTGTIEASRFVGGTIAIGSGNDVFKADLNGIWLGNSDFANAPFRVDMSGHMVATDGQFSGTITASTINGGTINGTDINGGVITGSWIRTSENYPFSEMNVAGNYFAVMLSSSLYAKISENIVGSPGVVLSDGVTTGTLFTQSLLGPTTVLASTTDIDLFLSNGSNKINVPSWSQLYSRGDGRTIQQELNALATLISLLNSVDSSLQSQINNLSARVTSLENA
jgi:hypothetical protein